MPEIQAGTQIQAVPKEKQEIGIDLNNSLTDNILGAYEHSTLDTTALENFTSISQSREQIYQLIDTMSNDDRVSAVLETYAEDVCEPNDRGEIIWCESADPDVAKYVSFLLDSMNIDKNMYKYAYSLIKYGDIYWRLYRESEYDKEDLFLRKKRKDEAKRKANLTEHIEDTLPVDIASQDDLKPLDENININYHSNSDKYVRYIDHVPNPGEMYELMRYGKTMGFIKAPTNVMNPIMDAMSDIAPNIGVNHYSTNENDVDVYQPTDYVHAALEDNSSRTPEEVDIFLDDTEAEVGSSITYTVRRGQSLLYSVFKVWRELSLLESSILLNRLTKASTVRIVEIEVGDMPKEKVQDTLRNVKSMVEQKSAINTNNTMAEYTNPGPVENTIYVPTKGEIGKITTQELGSDNADPKSLIDLDYFLNKFYGALRVPKQFFAQTDDSAGFDGGKSLSLISSRYGKSVKRIQNALVQGITDVVNLMLLDSGLDSYINKFTIKMQAPTTAEEVDRREAVNNEIGVIRDIMQIYTDAVEDPMSRLKALKALLSSSSQNPDLISLIQDEIEKLEAELEETEEKMPKFENDTDEDEERPSLMHADLDLPSEPASIPSETPAEQSEVPEVEDELPSFEELGIADAINLENN